jgi:hypothetical protein
MFSFLLGVSETCLPLASTAINLAALSIKSVVNKPIKFVGTGEKMDALDVFYPARMADRILGMGDVVSLVELAQEHYNEEEARKLQKKISNKITDLDLKEWNFKLKISQENYDLSSESIRASKDILIQYAQRKPNFIYNYNLISNW